MKTNNELTEGKLVAMVGQANYRNSGLINAYAMVFADTIGGLMTKIKDFYKDTFWLEKDDDLAVYPIITEANGYQHCGKEMLRVTSRIFYAKK